MALAPGMRLGPYEILAPLGAGGMGEVYRARDTRLERNVAIKVIPPVFALDTERLARFEREARVLASLNHPGIAAIYGLEDVGGAPCLILEFVEGETLAQRIGKGPLPVRETLEVGAQVAAAIEMAHERDIVHRDLKPGNVMLTASGMVKVLDFGLARGEDAGHGSSPNLSASPTAALSATGQGIILGTAPYMSPEQARGRKVDRRTDIWAFGCLLFECLTGRQAFEGETVSDVIARILEREPDWNALPGTLPTRLRDLIGRCLTKEVAERPRDIGDLRRELGAIAMQLSSPSGAVGGAAEAPSLAVLYFENLARDPDSEYFCSGITEDILTDLSKIKRLRVASRHAVARYRGAPVELSRVAADLGVRTVLEGSVRRAGDRVRITVQLVNAADGFQLWAERYDRTLNDVFAVQEEIAASIAQALRLALTPAETEQLVQNRPNDVRAYDLYLKGRAAYGRYSAVSLQEAMKLFRQAIEIDPDYALAWAGLADCHGQMVQWGHTDNPDETLRIGLEAARKAISINPKLAEAHKAEALIHLGAGDRPSSTMALKRALEANPRFTPALMNLGVSEFVEARLAGAERQFRRVLEIDPQEAFALTWLAFILKLAGREEETLAVADQLRRTSDDAFYVTAVHIFRMWVALDRNEVATAAEQLKRAREDGANEVQLLSAEAVLAARAGRREEATRIVADLGSYRELGVGGLILAAEAALTNGEPGAAERFLQRKIAGDFSGILIRLIPGLHDLLDRPAFGPRRSEAALVWPLESPMIGAACHALFREVRIESGRPTGSQITAG